MIYTVDFSITDGPRGKERTEAINNMPADIVHCRLYIELRVVLTGKRRVGHILTSCRRANCQIRIVDVYKY